jgi:hypothetical protein
LPSRAAAATEAGEDLDCDCDFDSDSDSDFDFDYPAQWIDIPLLGTMQVFHDKTHNFF